MDIPTAKNPKTRRQAKWVQRAMILLGWLLIIGAVAIGPLPGPGPLLLAPIGLALILKNSIWAKRRYAKFAKQHPQYGDWLHWMLRRSRAQQQPPFPDIRGDIIHLFRRDDLDQDIA